MNELGENNGLEVQDIKTQAILPEDLDAMQELSGSYEALFSRRSMKFREWGLHEKALTEENYRELILKEYTFLKRPVAIVNKQIFIGNAAKTVEALKKVLE
jgi:arsenate reductase (glutaredoxin)